MNRPSPLDELLNRAFQLAYFLHADKETALSVTLEAASKLEVVAVAQTKRLYYAGTKRSASAEMEALRRTKVFLSDCHLLQRLVYAESEKYERLKEESTAGIGYEQMLVHFIKHLVRVTVRRNSFYVVLGLSRLLHDYTTAEATEIYNLVVQDAGRFKDDCYYRSRKRRLMEEFRERFGERLQVTRGHRGEERFEAVEQAEEEHRNLATEALRRCVPWNTPCAVPESFDPLTEEIEGLKARAGQAEDAVEINRMHAALHPECYERLTRSLKLEAPWKRLALPRFSLAEGADDMNGRSGDRSTSHSLSGDELRAIKEELSELAARRKQSAGRLLSISVDGRELARLNTRRARRARIQLPENAELVEVHAIGRKGKRTLLALHFLEAERVVEEQKVARSKIVVEGGQKISFALSQGDGLQSDARTLLLTVGYSETNPARALTLLCARAGASAREAFGGRTFGAGAILIPAAFLLLMTLGAVTFAFLRQNISPQREPLTTARTPELWRKNNLRDNSKTSSTSTVQTSETNSTNGKKATQDDAAVEPKLSDRKIMRQPPLSVVVANGQRKENGAAPAKRGSDEVAEPAVTNPTPESIARAGTDETDAGLDATRSLPTASAAQSLAEVKRVYIEVSGDKALSQSLASAIATTLQASDGLKVTTDKDQADAALKIRVRQSASASASESDAGIGGGLGAKTDGPRTGFTARLVNENGDVLWQKIFTVSDRDQHDVVEKAAADIAGELTRSWQERRGKN